jgi:ceramide glucosyltransferase
MDFDWLLLIFAGLALAAHLASVCAAGWRCRARPPRPLDAEPHIAVIRPLCGVEDTDELTLRSGFELGYPSYELIFCCAKNSDPAVTLVRRLMAAHPHVPARLLVGDDNSTSNPKLNNVIKGWDATGAEWVVLADSNVLMPPDYLERLLAAWRPDTGLVCSPPVGCEARGFWAELECAFLNTYQCRWQYFADTLGLGFAQGKSMLWRRKLLQEAGGIRALGCEIAEDAAATKIVRGKGLRVRLVDGPFGQALGRRTAAQVWGRQLRWARLRRVTFPVYFFPEVLTGVVPPTAAIVLAADTNEVPLPVLVAALVGFWYGGEALLAVHAGWHLTRWSLPAWVLRDLALPVLWLQAWFGNSLRWRGNEIPLGNAGRSGL